MSQDKNSTNNNFEAENRQEKPDGLGGPRQGRACVLGLQSIVDIEEVHHLTDCRLSVGASVTDEKHLLCETQRNFMFDEAQGGCIWGEEFEILLDEEGTEDLMLYVLYHPDATRSPTTYQKEPGVLGEVGLPILQITEEDQELMSPIFHASGKEMARLTITVRWRSEAEIAAMEAQALSRSEISQKPQTPSASVPKQRMGRKPPPEATNAPAVAPLGAKPRDITLRFRSQNHPFVWDPALDEDEQWAAVCKALGLGERTPLLLKERAGTKGVGFRQLVSKGGPKTKSGILMVETRKTRPVLQSAPGSPVTPRGGGTTPMRSAGPAYLQARGDMEPRMGHNKSSGGLMPYRAAGLASHMILKQWSNRLMAAAFRVWKDRALEEGVSLQRGQLYRRLTKLKEKMQESLMEMREAGGLEATQPDPYTTDGSLPRGGGSPANSMRKSFNDELDVFPKTHDDLNAIIAALFVEYMQVECAWAGERETMVHKIDQLQHMMANAAPMPNELPPPPAEDPPSTSPVQNGHILSRQGSDDRLANSVNGLSLVEEENDAAKVQSPSGIQELEIKDSDIHPKQRIKVTESQIESIETQPLIDPDDEITKLFLQKHAQFYPGGKNALIQEGRMYGDDKNGSSNMKIRTNFTISPTRCFERHQDPTSAANVNRQGELQVPYLRNENSAEYQLTMCDQELALYMWAIFRNFMDPITYKPGGTSGARTKSSTAMMKMSMGNFRRFAQQSGILVRGASNFTPSKTGAPAQPTVLVPSTSVQLKMVDVDLVFTNAAAGASGTLNHYQKRKAQAKAIFGSAATSDSAGGVTRVPERKGVRPDKVLEFPDFVMAAYQLAQRAYPAAGPHSLRVLTYYQLNPLIKIVAPPQLAMEEEGARETLNLMDEKAVKVLEANQMILSSLYSYYAADMAGSMVESSVSNSSVPSWMKAPKIKSHKRSMSLEQAVVFCRDFGLSPQFVSMQQLADAWRTALHHCVDEVTAASNSAYNRLSYAGFLDFLGRLALRCLDEFCEPETSAEKRLLVLFDIINVSGGREKLLMDERASISRRAIQKGFVLV